MSIFEYNKEEEEKKLRKAEYEAGLVAGEIKKAKEAAASFYEMGIGVSDIARGIKVSEKTVKEWLKSK